MGSNGLTFFCVPTGVLYARWNYAQIGPKQSSNGNIDNFHKNQEYARWNWLSSNKLTFFLRSNRHTLCLLALCSLVLYKVPTEIQILFMLNSHPAYYSTGVLLNELNSNEHSSKEHTPANIKISAVTA